MKYLLTRNYPFPYLVAGLLSGFLSTIVWDIDSDNFLVTTIPGWSFALSFSIAFLSKSKNYNFKTLSKLTIWITVVTFCFMIAVAFVINELIDQLFLLLFLAGFISTLVMIIVFKLLFKVIDFKTVILISLLAGVIAYFGLTISFDTETFAFLFIPYHVFVASYLGYMIKNKQ
jgi:hypothetical protein